MKNINIDTIDNILIYQERIPNETDFFGSIDFYIFDIPEDSEYIIEIKFRIRNSVKNILYSMCDKYFSIKEYVPYKNRKFTSNLYDIDYINKYKDRFIKSIINDVSNTFNDIYEINNNEKRPYWLTPTTRYCSKCGKDTKYSDAILVDENGKKYSVGFNIVCHDCYELYSEE